MKIRFTIFGQPQSKANSRMLVHMPDGKGGKRPAFIKSSEARKYEKDALRQIPPLCRRQIEGPVRVTIRIFYASQRPDLDESVILDVLQDRYHKDDETDQRVLVQKGVYRNDRQVREKHIYWGLDKGNPRAEIEVEPLEAQLFDNPAPALTKRDQVEELPF
jgi:Holliday junction resolvase RusA-like endonuclease